MRVSLYGTLSSGFQIQKIWAMMKHDFIGLLRIVGMAILIAMAIAISAMVLALFFALICGGLIWLMSSGSSTSMVAAVLIVLLGAAFLTLLLFASAFSMRTGISAHWAIGPSIQCEPLERPGRSNAL